MANKKVTQKSFDYGFHSSGESNGDRKTLALSKIIISYQNPEKENKRIVLEGNPYGWTSDSFIMLFENTAVLYDKGGNKTKIFDGSYGEFKGSDSEGYCFKKEDIFNVYNSSEEFLRSIDENEKLEKDINDSIHPKRNTL